MNAIRPSATLDVQPAGDVSLFVLDRGGILLSESRQEIHALNEQAAYIWCLLEDGLSANEVVQSYAATYRVDQPTAWRHAAMTTRHWLQLGFVSAAPLELPADVHLASALASLLTSAALRAAFTRSPADTARSLGLRSIDWPAFVALDPAELDWQAQEIVEWQAARRNGGGSPADAARLKTLTVSAPELRGREWNLEAQPLEFPAERKYQFLTTAFSIRFVSTTLCERIHSSLSHLARPADTPWEITLSVVRGGNNWMIFDGIIPVATCDTEDEIAPLIKVVFQRKALARHPFFTAIHAGVVSFGGSCLMLPAAAGSGKSTLTAALLRYGATYLSDEIALLDEETLGVRPVPLAISVKAGSLALLEPHYPGLAGQIPWLREDRQFVRYLLPPEESRQADGLPHPTKWIVFPRVIAGADAILTSLPRIEALQRLMAELLVLPNALDRENVRRFLAWIRGLDCYDMTYSSLHDACKTLQRLVASPPVSEQYT